MNKHEYAYCARGKPVRQIPTRMMTHVQVQEENAKLARAGVTIFRWKEVIQDERMDT